MLIQNIKEAFRNLASNKMRSLLTMLGIIIGIAAVITITTIGNSIRSTLNATLNSLGGNSISAYVEVVWPEGEVDWDTWEYPEMTPDDYISQEMLNGLRDTYPDEVVGYLATEWIGQGKINKNVDTYANVEVVGGTEIMLDYMKLKLIRGRAFTENDLAQKKRVCIVSDVMAKNYFGDEDPVGQIIYFEGESGTSEYLTVVGVYKFNQAVFGRPDTTKPEKDRTTQMFVPYTTALKMSDWYADDVDGYQYVDILLKNTVNAEDATQHVNQYFEEQYADNPGFRVWTYSQASELGIIDTVINVITIAISLIAAISLVVGGVGVMNIMLVSITERTREIGIRKALGAKNRAIKQQFLIEAIVLCVIGGLIGIILGILLGIGLGNLAMMLISTYYSDFSSVLILNISPSWPAIGLSVIFSMLIGVFFGSYPANKAAKMEVIDALRYE